MRFHLLYTVISYPLSRKIKEEGNLRSMKLQKKPDTLLRGKYSIETDPQMTQMLALTFKQWYVAVSRGKENWLFSITMFSDASYLNSKNFCFSNMTLQKGIDWRPLY